MAGLRTMNRSAVWGHTDRFTSTGDVTLKNANVLVLKKSVGAATTVTLPSGPVPGRTVVVKDAKGDAATNNITVQGAAAATIDGQANVVLNVNYVAACFIWTGDEWSLLYLNTEGASGGTSFTGPVTITSNSASALAVGRQGATSPGLVVDASTATCVTGLKVTPAASGAGLALSLTGGASAESLTLDAKGTGTLTLNGTATGAVTIGSNLSITDAKNIVLGTSTGTKIGTATTQKIGFYNVTPVVQPAASADVTGFAAGAGTTAKSDSVWTGASGASAYTVGGIITGLKALGLLAA